MKSSQKIKVVLQSLKLIDVPTRQNRVFLKAKHGSFHVTTKPYQIKDNTVIFPDPVTIEMSIPDDLKKAKAVKSARLSFRFENTSGSGFTRYGIVMLNIVQHLLSNDLNVRCGLENCSEKPVFLCQIKMPPNFNLPIQSNVLIEDSEVSTSQSMSKSISSSFTSPKKPPKPSHHRVLSVAPKKAAYFEDLTPSDYTEPVLPVTQAHYPQSSRAPRIMHTSNSFNTLAEKNSKKITIVSCFSGENSVLSNQSSSTIQKPNFYERAPVKIPVDRFKILEEQVDKLLAGVIINN